MVRIGQRAEHLFNLIIIGDSTVGKTNILSRYSRNSFSKDFVTTIGVDFKTKTIQIDGIWVKLVVWDTAGSERFNSITTSYFRSAHGILMVYDITNMASFENLNKWYDMMKEHAKENIDWCLIGNKCDLHENRMISTQRGQDFADQHGVAFFETSAKNGDLISDVIENLGKSILMKIPEELRKTRKNDDGSRMLPGMEGISVMPSMGDSTQDRRYSDEMFFGCC